ncbi:hypothetical protein Psch_00510 [Pelotomaculum schinkii]|uniref:Lysine exporter LysO n=1 Tax=Pelotomaculum schinkii TaxID=78350 RepID=A0A4Y7RD84_9FIRM|nr:MULTISPECIES: lysine exporter LysO family protein [Pelotomaculum]TEB06975.1 hypothetical protein Psch_00510 [Pelotomaculum schinkii]TEB16863.1 hypothetical protein Psfp_01033 [Pelotomaculum sp. FP]
MTILVLICIVLGGLLGAALPPNLTTHLEALTTGALCFMLVGIGIELGSQKEAWLRLRCMGWRIMLVPVLVAVGSLGGAVAAGFFLGMPIKEASAVGAGFGWYSLSGVILSKIYSVETGALAFMTNIMRELISFVIIPIVAARIGNLAAVAPGGATTMDTTLPLIARTTDADTAVIALVNGTTLSAMVPLLVPLLIGL